jgi:hypothetical protein
MMKMSKKLLEARAIREAERVKRVKDLGNKFNNLMLQFRAMNYNCVDYVCSLLKTPSVATVYNIFLEKPHFFTYEQIWDKANLHDRTVQKAIKTLEWFGVIEHLDNEPETWALVLENWRDYR